MIEILHYIKKRFPTEWLSDLGEYEGTGGVDIHHPKNDVEYLTISIFPDIIGVGVLLEKDKDILIDLNGFDYSFNREDIDSLKSFLDHFYETGGILKKN